MITCNRCGKQVPAGMARCQNCGMPVSGVGKDRMDAQEQSELPAWLESLRANERPAATQQSFSTADLIDEDDLPGWMRADQAAGLSDSSKHPAIRPASLSAPNTDAGMMRPGGFSASELIDPASLPSWIQPNAQPTHPPAPSISMEAHNVKIYPQGSGPRPTPDTRSYPETPSHLLSAGDLIDRQSLPPWMAGQANQPSQQLNQATWQGGQTPQASPGNAGSGQQPGLAASSLLDTNALPSWLREGQQAQGYANAPVSQGQFPNSGMAAGSLIDMNALPAWLRAADGQSQAATGGNVPPAPYGTANRIENMRVPSRPRAEMTAPEQSEVAANVFSSMLGVASTAPYYPAQPSGPLSAGQSVPPTASPSAFGSNQGAPGTTPGGYAGNYQGGYQNAQNPYAAYPGSYQSQPLSPLAQAQNPAMQPGTYNGGQGAVTNQASARTGKRSFLDTIREWFHL